jgi:hypothetical protein
LPPAPETSIRPAIVTSPVARRCTGVFAALRRNFNTLLLATFMVVQLKIPLSGTSSVVSTVTFKTPYDPSLPEEKFWAKLAKLANTSPIAMRDALVFISFYFFYNFS